jgi:predicted nucleic acid-binding protein
LRHEHFTVVWVPILDDPYGRVLHEDDDRNLRRAAALNQVDIWLESPSLALLTESPTHWATWRAILVESAITGARVHDAHIMALCRQHGVRELWSVDRDFSRFAGVKVVNPLVGQHEFHEE